MEPEVRYQMLRPAQIVEQRNQCPVAYIPIGTLEWHGVHNPVGADTLQAEALATLAAKKGGGLVFPPLYYGENRLQALMEANAADREQIAEGMDLSPDNFTPAHHPFSIAEQTQNYHRLLLHVLTEAGSLGFRVGVLVAGHYPLIDHTRAAATIFNQTSRRCDGMLAWATLDYVLIQDRYENAGDHGAKWETSHLLGFHPETVDLSLLPPKGEHLVGVNGIDPREATPEFGRETLEASADVLVKEVQHRLEHRECYLVHGASMREGLWRSQ